MLKEIGIEELQNNVFDKIGKEWMLIAAGNGVEANAMTASWGGMGVLWGCNVVYIFVRPQRYTKKRIDENEHFSITFFDENYRSMLAYMGKVSGKDENKIEASDLHLLQDRAPYFEEANCALICRKLFAQELDPNCFLDGSLDARWYPEKDYHIMYVAKIEKVLVKQ